MFALSGNRQLPFRQGLINLTLVITLLLALIGPVQGRTLAAAPVAAPPAGVLQTLGDFLSLGANTVREIQQAIQMAGQETRDTLEQLNGELTGLINKLEQTYQNNLNITLNSLDAVTRTKVVELQSLIEQVNATLQADIGLVQEASKDVIRTASFEIRRDAQALEDSLKDVIVVGGETAAYVVDRAIYDGILFVALVLLGLGGLLFVWLLFTRRPSGFGGVLAYLFIVAYMGVFGALVLWPPARGYAMTYSGIGLQQRLEVVNVPHIVDLVPEQITLGETQELQIWGSLLTPKGQVPTVTIGGQPVTVRASNDQQVVVDVHALTGVPDGSAEIVLTYAGRPDSPRGVVWVAHPVPTATPPDLVLTAFSINPASPVQGRGVQASVTVRNQGGSKAGQFAIQWQPRTGFAGQFQTTAVTGGLEAGATQTFNFSFTYPNAGTFDSVALVDYLNTVSESSEGNNSATRHLVVQPAPPRRSHVVVHFNTITIHDDADPAGSGEIWLDLTVHGQALRIPNSGTNDWESGQTYNLNRQIAFDLTEGDRLTIFATGTDEDSPGFPLFDNNDPMGTINKSFDINQNWGQGAHDDRSTCPDGCYTLHYTVDVTPLP